jgi:anaerobic magnesium-protoporphyrin IX monomethyl ester cyclase
VLGYYLLSLRDAQGLRRLKILFLYPDVGTMLPPDYQHGVGTLLAVLSRAGHEVGLIYAHEEYEREGFVAEARAFGPDLLAVSSVSNQFPRAARYAGWIKEALRVPVILGGTHATMAPAETIALPCFDLLCVGEGEGAMVELAEALDRGSDYSRIENLWVKQGDEVIKNPLRPLVEDLDSLPFVDRESFRFERILAAQDGKCSMLSGRGCPYGCTFCANRGLSELYRGKGRFVRWRSVDHVFAEMRELLAHYAVKKWEFNDDIFTLKREWFEEYCARYPREFSVPFDVNVRVETVDREMLERLKAAGCDLIRIGVESGSERVRREIMGRGMPQERIERVFADAEAVGLKTWSFNMVGLPGETPADAEETLAINARLCPDHMQVSVFNPYPGTRLFEVCKERGVLPGRTVDGYFLPDSTLLLPEFPPDQINATHQRLIRLRDQCTTKKRLLRELAGRAPAVDFVDALAGAEIASPEPIFVGEDYFWIGEDARRVLRVHPPSRVRYRVTVPGRSELRASLAMHPQVLDMPGGDGVIFIIRIGRSPRKMTEVLNRVLDPKRNSLHRGWHDITIPLDQWVGKKVIIEFETRTVDPTRPDFNTVGFGYPLILCPST